MNCPKCDAPCNADWVHNGVGMQQVTPYECINPFCAWREGDDSPSAEEDTDDFEDEC